MYNGVSALKSTQKGMDVIGNNISNVNTTGFKSSSVTFADQLSDTLKASSGPSKNTGGENGQQIGLGVRIGSIDVNTNQGGLNSTGESTDLGIEGNGYFMLTNDGGDVRYTRRSPGDRQQRQPCAGVNRRAHLRMERRR
jgi:flagellar hook protein FlgE